MSLTERREGTGDIGGRFDRTCTHIQNGNTQDQELVLRENDQSGRTFG